MFAYLLSYCEEYESDRPLTIIMEDELEDQIKHLEECSDRLPKNCAYRLTQFKVGRYGGETNWEKEIWGKKE